jgi:DNA-directed RNA polymerase specialized sigma24 family protein
MKWSLRGKAVRQSSTYRKREELTDESSGDLEQELSSLPEVELLRLKVIAQWRVSALPGLAWSDLLNEAIVRVLSGDRQRPPGTPLAVFLAGTMRSICSEHWRRLRKERQLLIEPGAEGRDPLRDAPDNRPGADPERAFAAAQTLSLLCRLFDKDDVVMTIIAGLAEGLTAREICSRHGLTNTEYDSARKRMRRAILRHGLEGSDT